MMALAGVELETLVFKPDALYVLLFLFFYYGSMCIVDNGSSGQQTRIARFRARRAKLCFCNFFFVIYFIFFIREVYAS